MRGRQRHRPQAKALHFVGHVGVVLDLGGAGDRLQEAAGGAVGATDEVVQDGRLLLVGEPALRGHVFERGRHVPDRDTGLLLDLGQPAA